MLAARMPAGDRHVRVAERRMTIDTAHRQVGDDRLLEQAAQVGHPVERQIGPGDHRQRDDQQPCRTGSRQGPLAAGADTLPEIDHGHRGARQRGEAPPGRAVGSRLAAPAGRATARARHAQTPDVDRGRGPADHRRHRERLDAAGGRIARIASHASAPTPTGTGERPSCSGNERGRCDARGRRRARAPPSRYATE